MAFPSSQIKGICCCRSKASVLQGCPLARAQGTPGESCAEAQLCAATQKGFGAELIGIFLLQKHKNKRLF